MESSSQAVAPLQCQRLGWAARDPKEKGRGEGSGSRGEAWGALAQRGRLSPCPRPAMGMCPWLHWWAPAGVLSCSLWERSRLLGWGHTGWISLWPLGFFQAADPPFCHLCRVWDPGHHTALDGRAPPRPLSSALLSLPLAHQPHTPGHR